MGKDEKASKGGRPKKRLDARVLRRVRAMLIDEEQPESAVIDHLGLTVAAWRKLIETDAALADVLEYRRLREEEKFVDTLKRANGPVGAIFALKARHGYVDRAPPPKADEQRVNIVVHLPRPAASDAEYRRVIDAEFAEVPALPPPADNIDDLV